VEYSFTLMLSAPAPEVDEDTASEACGTAGYSAAWVGGTAVGGGSGWTCGRQGPGGR
jgi:hypothetical protein